MDLEKIRGISWYRQQTGSNPYFAYQASLGCVTTFSQAERIYWLCNLEEARGFMDKTLLGELTVKYLSEEKTHPGNLVQMFEEWKKSVCGVDSEFFKEIDSRGLHTMSDRELLALNKRLASQTFLMWTKFFMDIYDVDAEGLVEKELVDAGITLSPEEKNEMLLHPKLMAFQREHLDLIRVAKLIKATPNSSSTFLYIANPSNLHRLELYPEIEKALSEHQKAYFWIRNSWFATSVVSIFDFVEILKQILFSSHDLDGEYKELINYEESIKEKKKRIADKYNMSVWLRQMFDFFGFLAYWRDERKMEMQKMNYYLELLGREIGKRSGLDWHEIKVCDPLLITGIPVGKDLLEKCKKLFNEQFILTWDGEKVVHLAADDASAVEKTIEQIIESEVTEIRGMIACPGKVRGEVVVINQETEFHKMKEGAVLVANMTRPEYVSIMKKAIAIVTDEGGITSHAAVVSRELKIPCIIGTQVATKKLKDGDKVFVNADHGVVIVE